MKIKLDKGAYMPVRGHRNDAGLDLRTPIAFGIEPGGSVKIQAYTLRYSRGLWVCSRAKAV